MKKAEHQRIDTFELWCWRRLLRVPWTARRSNQSILKEISPGCSLERLMLKLKLQSFGHLMQRTDSLEKTLMLGKIEGKWRRDDRGWDGWMASLTRWTWVWISSGSWWWTGKPGVRQSMGSQRVGHNWATKRHHHHQMLEERYGSVTPSESPDRNKYANTLIPDLRLQNHERINFCCPKLQFIVLFYNSPWNLIYTHTAASPVQTARALGESTVVPRRGYSH